MTATHSKIETLAEVRSRQMVWAQWMADATAGLADSDRVETITHHTPFGSYLVGLAPENAR